MAASIYMIVVGKADVGKSTFINSVLGTEAAPVGDGMLDMCTQTLTKYTLDLPDGPPVVLVDTPGFDGFVADGSAPSDVEIFKMLEDFLGELSGDAIVHLLALYSIAGEGLQVELDRGPSARAFERILARLARPINIVTLQWEQIDSWPEGTTAMVDPEVEPLSSDTLFSHLVSTEIPAKIYRCASDSTPYGCIAPRDVVSRIIGVSGGGTQTRMTPSEGPLTSNDDSSELPSGTTLVSSIPNHGLDGASAPGNLTVADLLEQLKLVTDQRDRLRARCETLQGQNSALLSELTRTKAVSTSPEGRHGLVPGPKDERPTAGGTQNDLTEDQKSVLHLFDLGSAHIEALYAPVRDYVERATSKLDTMDRECEAAETELREGEDLYDELYDSVGDLVAEYSRLIRERDGLKTRRDELEETLRQMEASQPARRRSRLGVDPRIHIKESLAHTRAVLQHVEGALQATKEGYENRLAELRQQSHRVNDLNIAYESKKRLAQFRHLEKGKMHEFFSSGEATIRQLRTFTDLVQFQDATASFRAGVIDSWGKGVRGKFKGPIRVQLKDRSGSDEDNGVEKTTDESMEATEWIDSDSGDEEHGGSQGKNGRRWKDNIDSQVDIGREIDELIAILCYPFVVLGGLILTTAALSTERPDDLFAAILEPIEKVGKVREHIARGILSHSISSTRVFEESAIPKLEGSAGGRDIEENQGDVVAGPGPTPQPYN